MPESERLLFNRIRSKCNTSATNQQLWIDILRPQNSKEVLCEMSTVNNILRWLKVWKRRLDRVENSGNTQLIFIRISVLIVFDSDASNKQQCSSGNKKKKRKHKKRRLLNDDDDDEEEEEDEDSRDCEYELDTSSDLSNTLLISGSVGCGKTSLVRIGFFDYYYIFRFMRLRMN